MAGFASGSESKNSSGVSVTGGFSPTLMPEASYFVGYMNYLNYLNSLSDTDIQSAAENRANALYAHMKYNEQHKIENKPLKVIAEELKRHNQ